MKNFSVRLRLEKGLKWQDDRHGPHQSIGKGLEKNNVVIIKVLFIEETLLIYAKA